MMVRPSHRRIHPNRLSHEQGPALNPGSLLSGNQQALGPQRFKAVMDQVLSMATGTFAQLSSQHENGNNERRGDLRAMDVALGLGHARTDIVGGDKRIIKPELDYSSILQETFEPLGQVSSMASILETIDPERLRIVTKSLTGLLRSIAEASAELDRLLIKDAFGLIV
jgi:hypothetical protein